MSDDNDYTDDQHVDDDYATEPEPIPVKVVGQDQRVETDTAVTCAWQGQQFAAGVVMAQPFKLLPQDKRRKRAVIYLTAFAGGGVASLLIGQQKQMSNLQGATIFSSNGGQVMVEYTCQSEVWVFLNINTQGCFVSAQDERYA